MAERQMPTNPVPLYPSNSFANKASKPEQKQIKAVTTGKVQKQGIFKRLGRALLEDSIANAREAAMSDIIVPGIKSLIYDTLVEGLSVVLFGSFGAIDPGRSRNHNYTSYSRYYEKRNGRSGPIEEYKGSSRRVYDVDDIIVESRRDAIKVLEEAEWIIHKYGQLSVADYYDIVGITSPWTEHNYGWISLEGAGIRSVRDGFLIVMPAPKLLDD